MFSDKSGHPFFICIKFRKKKGNARKKNDCSAQADCHGEKFREDTLNVLGFDT